MACLGAMSAAVDLLESPRLASLSLPLAVTGAYLSASGCDVTRRHGLMPQPLFIRRHEARTRPATRALSLRDGGDDPGMIDV